MPSQNKSSEYIGVSKRKNDKKWRAASVYEGNRYHLGMHINEREAAKAVDLFRIKKGLKAINGTLTKNGKQT